MTIHTEFATLETTNGATATLKTFGNGLNCGFVVRVFAWEPATEDKAVFWVQGGRDDGTPAVISSSVTMTNDAGAATWTVEIDESGGARVRVTGEVGKTIEWGLALTYWTPT